MIKSKERKRNEKEKEKESESERQRQRQRQRQTDRPTERPIRGKPRFFAGMTHLSSIFTLPSFRIVG